MLNKKLDQSIQQKTNSSTPFIQAKNTGNFSVSNKSIQKKEANNKEISSKENLLSDKSDFIMNDLSDSNPYKSQAPLVGLNNNKNETINIPNVVTVPGSGYWKGGEELLEDVSVPKGVSNVVADLKLNFIQKKTSLPVEGKEDSVSSNVLLGNFTQPGGKRVSPFGSESFEPAFTNVNCKFSGGNCLLKAQLDVECPWGTNAGGRVDVPSATDTVVTKNNWTQIRDDLMPSSKSPHKSPRRKYYSKALVERHEKFHGTDDFKWVKTSGLGIVKLFIEAGNISSKKPIPQAQKLLQKARRKLINENLKWYKGGGTSHSSYLGEIRAYADGKPLYEKLAKGVEKHGKTLK